MRKLGLVLSAAAVSVAMLAGSGQAEARDRTRDVLAGAALGVAGGVLLGQALAPPPVYAAPPPPRVYYPAPAYVAPPPVVYDAPPRVIYRERPHRVNWRAAHRDWCESRYNSYSPYDDTWVDRRGRVRVCVSPYSN